MKNLTMSCSEDFRQGSNLTNLGRYGRINMRITFLIIVILLTSCSTTTELMIPYEVSKTNLNSYFQNRSKPVKKQKKQEVVPSELQIDFDKLIKPEETPLNELVNQLDNKVLFDANFSETSTQSKAQWTLNTGRRFSKQDNLFPTFLHVNLIKKSNTIYI